MAPTRIILQLFGLTLFANAAVAILCYRCDSSLDDGCADFTSATKLQAEVCTPSKVNPDSNSWLKELIAIVVFGSSFDNDSTNNMVCQKIVGKQGDNLTTIRSCQFHAGETDPCALARRNLEEKNDKNLKIESCTVCNQDYCNSAPPRMTTYTTLGLTIVTSMGYLLRQGLY